LPEKYVLYFGSNKPHKNLPRLVEAFARWHTESRESQIRLVVAGQWDVRYPEAKQRAEDLNAPVLFIGSVDDAALPALYSSATAFVFPSLYEGFGLPPLEAMACGVPVVCSNAASLPEVVGDAALLVNPRAAEEIAAAITRVLTDAALRDELRAKSLVRASQFSWERTARATLRVYESVAKNK
jgi:alpha-1,3-rhamnosyl/mannosyltransferase